MRRRLLFTLVSMFLAGFCHTYTDSLWIVCPGGQPGSLIAADVWLQYEGGGGGDVISAFDIPLTWEPVICSVEAVVLGPDFRDANWMNVSQIDNQGTAGPPLVPKVNVASFLPGPVGPPIPRGTHLAATLGIRIFDTAMPPDSMCLDTLMEAFSPPVCLGFWDSDGMIKYVPSFSPACIRVLEYSCGDCNGDGRMTLSDAVYLVDYAFRGGPAPLGEGDVNVDGRVTIADATYIVAYIYRNGPPPCEPPLSLNPSHR